MEKTPLAYENLREDDELYKQVIWRNINTKEKMNLPFNYEADEDNGNQRFINIILKALKEGINDSTPLVAFNGLDDRFTTPMKPSEISQLLVGSSYTIQVGDWSKDPDGSKGITKDSIISDEFNPESIETYQVKEEVIFDRKTSRLHFRILGIAPMKKSVDAEGNTRGEFPLFWLYYQDVRPVLAKYEAYNPRNYANRMSWEEVFESHYFSSYIVKSTISNNGNKYIAATEKDQLMRLVQGEAVKEQIFNFEQSQWSY
jgi:gliding motility associated protien GldN